MPLPTEPTAFPQLSPLSVIRMMWKRKIAIAVVVLVLGLVAGVVIYRWPATYRSEALILVDSQKIPEKYVASTVSTDLQDRLATISQQILSNTRLKKIVEDFDLYHDYRQRLVEEEILEMMRNDISLRIEKGWARDRPGAFRVGYQGGDPNTVAQVANRLANLYVEENLRVRENQAEGTSEFIETQLREAERRLNEQEAAVSKYKMEHRGELPQQENSIASAVAQRQIELQSNRDGLVRAEQSKATLANMLSMAENTVTELSRVAENSTQFSKPTAAAAANGSPETEASKIEQAIAVLRGRYTESHPEVVRLRKILGEISALEAARRKEPPAAADDAGSTTPMTADPRRALAIGQARERVNALRTQAGLVEKEIESRKAEQERLMREIAGLQERLSRLPVREQEMAVITRDYEISKTNYKNLFDKKLAAEMSTDMERRQKSERFTILDPARLPEKPFKPNRPLFGGLAGAAVLLMGIAGAVVFEIQRGSVLGEWELPAGTPVLGRLPAIDVSRPEDSSSLKRRIRSRWLKRKFNSKLLTYLAFALLLAMAFVAAVAYYGWETLLHV